MDFASCTRNRLVKQVHVDNNIIKSLIQSSAKKLKSQKKLELDDDTAGSKVSLAYDALRELLEALAIMPAWNVLSPVQVLVPPAAPPQPVQVPATVTFWA